MATVQEIIAINSRPGNSEKGGSQTYGITLDASPFQRLAEYTYLDNVQKQKDKTIKDQAIATEMGTTMALDPNSTNKELYEALNKQKEEINYLVKNNLDIFDYNKNPAANTKLKELLGQFSANRAKATAFDVLNNSAQTEIGKLTPDQQEAAKQVLENKRKLTLIGGADNFFKTGTQLDTSIMDFKPEDYSVPKLGALEYTIAKIGGNNNISTEIKLADINSARAKSKQEWLGIQTDTFVPKPNPNNDTKIALENDNARIYAQSKKGKGKFSQETVNKLNDLIAEYKNKKTEWDKNPVGKPPQKTDQMIAIDAVNQNITAINSALDEVRANSPNLNVPKYELIDYEDGISGDELVLAETLTSQAGTLIKRDQKAINTNSAITAENNRQDYEVAKYNSRTSRINATRPTTTNPTTGLSETESAYDSIVATMMAKAKDNQPINMKVSDLTVYQAYALNPDWVIKKENGTLSFSDDFNSAKNLTISKYKDGPDGKPGQLGFEEESKGADGKSKKEVRMLTADQVDDGGVGITYQLPNTKQDGKGIFGQRRKSAVTPGTPAAKPVLSQADLDAIIKRKMGGQ